MEIKPYDFLSIQLTDKEISKLEPFNLDRCLKGEMVVTRAGHPVIIYHYETELRDPKTEPCLVGYLLTKRAPHRVIGTHEWFVDGSFTSNRSIKDFGDLVGMYPTHIESTPLKPDELINGQTYWAAIDQEIIQCVFENQPEFFRSHPVFLTKEEAESYLYPILYLHHN